MVNQCAPILMTLSHLEGHLLSKTFLTRIPQTITTMFSLKVHMACNFNCIVETEGLLNDLGSRVHVVFMLETVQDAVVVNTGGSKGGRGGPCPPRHVGKRPECTKSRHFQTQNRQNFLGRGQCPLPRPQLVFLCINHNVCSRLFCRLELFAYT